MKARNKAGELTEQAWQGQVEGLARFYGWLAYHTHDSRRSAAGFPDLVMVRGPELIFAELKTRTGRVRPEQQAWVAALNVVAAVVHEWTEAATLIDEGDLPRPAVDVYIWRPADFDDVHARLARGRVRQPASFE